MKIKFAAATVAVIAAVLLGLMVGRASAGVSEPIPGIDVIVRKTPGSVAVHATTDKSGHFAFENLKAGTYELSANVPQTKSSKHTGVVQFGMGDGSVQRTLGTGQPATIEITKDGGKIAGTVTLRGLPASKFPPNGVAPEKATKDTRAR